MLLVTKIFEFEACHKLPQYDGACHNLHGHSYKLEVTVSGRKQEEFVKVHDSKIMNPKAGMIIDFKDLKSIVKEVAIDKYDHAYLNDFFENPTAEIMVEKIAFDIMEKLPKEVILVSCKLWETSTSYAEFNPLMDYFVVAKNPFERPLLDYANQELLKSAT